MVDLMIPLYLSADSTHKQSRAVDLGYDLIKTSESNVHFVKLVIIGASLQSKSHQA